MADLYQCGRAILGQSVRIFRVASYTHPLTHPVHPLLGLGGIAHWAQRNPLNNDPERESNP